MNYKSYMDLSRTIQENITKLPQDIDIIVAIPRSGFFPALIISSYLNIPVCSLDLFLLKEIPSVGFYRTPQRNISTFDDIRKVLILDDSICSGQSLINVKNRVASLRLDEITILYGAVYYIKDALSLVDVAMEEVPLPRFFQWNIFSHGHFLGHACMDVDGVVCDDPPPEDNDDGDRYRNFILNAKPRFFPAKGNVISCFVTSRLEKYRKETETWLKKYYDFNELIMLDLPSKEERIRQNAYALYKAKIYKNRNEILFIESNAVQASEIAELSQKPVFCTDTMEFFSQSSIKSESVVAPNFLFKKGWLRLCANVSQFSKNIMPRVKKIIKNLLPYYIVRIWHEFKSSRIPDAQKTECQSLRERSQSTYCPYCKKKSIFVPSGVEASRAYGGCPDCGSKERDRALFYVYQILFVTQPQRFRVLHFAPEACQFHFLISRPNIDYECADLYPENFPHAFNCQKQDATLTTYKDSTFDVIIANHVLEHIDEDLFLNEMLRILKNDGFVIISIPVYWANSLTLDNKFLAQSSADRKRYFGQEDHIRKYGSDVVSRLSRYCKVQAITAHDMRPLGDAVNTNIFILKAK